VRLVLFDDGFQMFLTAGLTEDEAIEKVSNGVKSGALGLWCNGTKMSLFNIREHVRIGRYHDENRVTVYPASGSWQEGLVFQLDAEEIEALIVTLSTPTPEPGRPPLEDKRQAILNEAERLRTAGEPISGTSLHAWAEARWGPDAPSERSIYRWLADPRSQAD
jgi:hypothetical protein